MNLLLAHHFPLEGVVDDAFIEAALAYPFERADHLFLVEERDPAKDRDWFAPYNWIDNLAELHEYLEEYRGFRVKLSAKRYDYVPNEKEVVGYVPYGDEWIYTGGPY